MDTQKIYIEVKLEENLPPDIIGKDVVLQETVVGKVIEYNRENGFARIEMEAGIIDFSGDTLFAINETKRNYFDNSKKNQFGDDITNIPKLRKTHKKHKF
jgi:hypothetical protein